MQLSDSQTAIIKDVFLTDLLLDDRFCDETIRFLMNLRQKLYRMPLVEMSRDDRDLYDELNEFHRQVGFRRVSQAFEKGRQEREGAAVR